MWKLSGTKVNSFFGQYKLINVLLDFRKVWRNQGKRHLIPFIYKNDYIIYWYLECGFLVIAAIPGCVRQCVRFAVVWCWTLYLQPAEGDSGDSLLAAWLMGADIWPRSHVHRWHGGATHGRSELFHVVWQNGTSDSFIRPVCSSRRLWFSISALSSQICASVPQNTFSPLNTRQVRCWYSLMGSKRQGVRRRRSADRKRDQIKTFLSPGTNSCLTHFSWKSPSTRKMASWLTWRYFITRLFDVIYCLTTWVKDEQRLFYVKCSYPVKPSSQGNNNNNSEINYKTMKYTMKSCRNKTISVSPGWWCDCSCRTGRFEPRRRPRRAEWAGIHRFAVIWIQVEPTGELLTQFPPNPKDHYHRTKKKKTNCISRLRQLITENRLWPVEIMRQKPANPKVARVYDKCVWCFLYCFTIVS